MVDRDAVVSELANAWGDNEAERQMLREFGHTLLTKIYKDEDVSSTRIGVGE